MVFLLFVMLKLNTGAKGMGKDGIKIEYSAETELDW